MEVGDRVNALVQEVKGLKGEPRRGTSGEKKRRRVGKPRGEVRVQVGGEGREGGGEINLLARKLGVAASLVKYG